MKEPIVNKVAKSSIVTIDLENFKTEGKKIFVDIVRKVVVELAYI